MRRIKQALPTAVLLAVLPVVLGLTGCSSSGSGSPASGSAGSPSSAQVAATSSDVSFVVGGTTTYGTLETPAHRPGQRLAAAVLIPGSGPTDRNGNEAGGADTAATLQLLADLLAKQGVMSLRYDKYFTGRTGLGTYVSSAPRAPSARWRRH